MMPDDGGRSGSEPLPVLVLVGEAQTNDIGRTVNTDVHNVSGLFPGKLMREQII